MGFHPFTAEEKLTMLQRWIRDFKEAGASPPDILKAIAADYQARADINRGRALSELTRAMRKIKQSKTDLGYSQASQVTAAQQLIRWWPTIQDALEQYGEESTE